MKKYLEILEDIKNTKAQISNTAEKQKALEFELLKDAYKNGTPEDIERQKAAREKALKAYEEETRKNSFLKIKIEILKDNAKQAFLSENINKICEIWNKYEGKPHGEKTAAKIREELRSATGYYISISNKWSDAHINISFYNAPNAPAHNIEFIPRWNGSEYFAALSGDNKILKLNAERFGVYLCGEYVEDIDAHAKKIQEAHQAAIVAKEAYQAAADAYNELTRGAVKRINTRENIENII